MKIRTSNSTDQSEMRLSASICTANVADAANGTWVPIAPYGEHAAPDGTYVQQFSREQADKVVATWNSVTGVAARIFKNLWHGLGPKKTCPVWDGHPETDKKRWPKAKLLAELTDVRAGDGALEGRIQWTGNTRTSGKLYPSPLWWHWPPTGNPPTVFPELLESVGLVPDPNIANVPAWTQNAAPNLASQSEAERVEDPNQNQTANNTMDRKKIIELLGLPADATDEQIHAALGSAGQTANALQTANAAKTDAETKLVEANNKLTTANQQVESLTTEREQLQTANGALTAERASLITGILDIAEKRGAITPAEREGFQNRLSTANTAAAALTELQTRKAMSTASVEINGNRIDLSTANARATALETAIAQKMKDGNLSREQAFAACQGDEKLKPLFASMQDPTRKD